MSDDEHTVSVRMTSGSRHDGRGGSGFCDTDRVFWVLVTGGITCVVPRFFSFGPVDSAYAGDLDTRFARGYLCCFSCEM